MKKNVNSQNGIKERIPKAFKSKLPLVAGLSASLALFPCGYAGIAHAANENSKGKTAVEMKEESISQRMKQSIIRKNPWAEQLVKKLIGSDVKAAVDAAKILSKMGGKAIPEIVKLLDDDLKNSETQKRALAVLHSMKWDKIRTAEKKIVVVKMFPLLLRFDISGRTQESMLAGWTMLKIGDEAMPAFCALLKSDIKIVNVLAIMLLNDVEWNRISAKRSFEAADALGRLSKGEDELGTAARDIIKRIKKIYILCGGSPGAGKGIEEVGTENRNTETGNSQLETENAIKEVA